MTKFDGTSPPLVHADLEEVEHRFGFKFPDALRKHYLRHNGGHPDRDRFVDENGTCIVHDFLPIKTSALPTLGTLEKSLQRLKVDRSIVPNYLVQFATDPCGNFYCFSTRDEDFGAIYWFKTESNPKRAADYLASSLDDFLGKLRSKEG